MLNKFSVRVRLILLLLVTSVAMLIVGIVGISGINLMSKEIDDVYHGGIDQLEHLVVIRENLSTEIMETVVKSKIGLIPFAEAMERIKKGREAIDTAWSGVMKGIAENIFSSENDLKKHAAQFDSQIKILDDYLRKLQNLQSFEGKDEVIKDIFNVIDPLNKIRYQIAVIYITDSKKDYEEAKRNASNYDFFMVITLIIGLLISVVFAFIIIRSIVAPLNYVVENLDRVAEGDTSMKLVTTSGGELGKLLCSVQNLIASSEKMCGILASFARGDLTANVTSRSQHDTLGISLTEMSVQMKKMIGEIKEEVNVLSSSSQEIMASLSQLSSGTAESAAAVTETTTTLEELKQTSHVSSEKAKEVLVSAEETLKTVTMSERSVKSTIEDMTQIRDRMQIISESILKLSEKSLAIAEIMDSVNDIAEQSNLLAVNAAIEAAKAGEQGRSFSIVAQEIRTLAEQSKGATVQVRSLLSEIQNATNAAVMATEQGSKAVAKGVDQSTQTSTAIGELAGNMKKVTQSANQIVLSNQQQSIGTEQISIAMSNINEATQQHVERLKEIEAAIAALNKVSTSLKGLTDQYKIG